MNELHLQELKQALEQGELVLFIGADLPRELTGVPARGEIAADLARRHGLPASDSLSEISALIQEGSYRRDLITVLLDAYASAQPAYFHHAVLWLVQEHGLRNIVTTAVDRGLELACDAEGILYTSIVDDTDLEFADASQLRIFRLYGHIQRKDRLVITEDDHAQLLNDSKRRAMLAAIRLLFRQNTALFVGYNLRHPDFKFLLQGRSGQDLIRRAFVVWPSASKQERRMWERRQIIILPHDPFHLTELPEMAAIDREKAFTAADDEPVFRGAGEAIDAEPPTDPETIDAEPTRQPREEPRLSLDTLRIDAAAPERVTLNQAFVLAVAVRQPDSPLLQESDLDVVHSGEAQVFVRSDQPYVTLRLQISAPGCEIDGESSRQFRLPLGHDSPVFYFNLIPRQQGELSIIIQLYQEDNWLGSARLRTQAVAAPAGSVQVRVISHDVPAFSKEDRIASLRRRLNKAQQLLAIIEEELAIYAAGSQPPELVLKKRDQEDLIRELEMELDSLLAADD